MVFLFQKWYARLSKKDIKIFLVTFAITFLTHMFRLLNYIPNHDSLGIFYDEYEVVTFGRWACTYAAGISSYFDIQWLIGLMSLIYISLTAIIVAKVLCIENILLCYITGIIIGIYPSVVCTFSYMYTADAYFLAMFLSALAAWFMVSDCWKKRLAGSIVLSISMGIYQAYVSFTIVLILAWLVKRFLFEEQKPGRYLFNLLYSGILGGVLYVIALFIRLNGRSLSTYQGISESSLIHSLSFYVSKFIASYTQVYHLIVQADTYGNDVIGNIVFILWILVLTGILLKCIGLIKNKKYFSLLCGILFLLMIPAGIYCLQILSEGMFYHRLMLQSAALVWTIPIMLLDNIKQSKIIHIYSELLVLIIFIIVGNYMVGANICYLGFYTGYEKTYALAIRIVDRIEQIRGTEEAEYVYITGTVNDEHYTDLNFERVMDGMTGMSHKIIPYNSGLYVRMINQHIGGNYKNLNNQEQIEDILSSYEYENMPIWPAQDSVKLINGVVVVKIR